MIVTNNTYLVMEDMLRDPENISKWQNWIRDNEPNLLKLISTRASIVSQGLINRLNTMGQLTSADIYNAMISSAIISTVFFIQGSNEANIVNVDASLLADIGSSDPGHMYERWMQGLLPEKYYTAEHMSEEATTSEDWEAAVVAYKKRISDTGKSGTKRLIMGMLPLEISDSKDVKTSKEETQPPVQEEVKVLVKA